MIIMGGTTPISQPASTYSLADPIPSATYYSGAVYAVDSYGVHFTMFEDASNNIHLLGSFGSNPWWSHYVNTDTDAHALAEGGLWNQGRHILYDVDRNKLYVGSEYIDDTASFDEFDVATMAWTRIATGTGWNTPSATAFGTHISIVKGGDGLIYTTFQPRNYDGMRCYSYDPDVGAASWTDYGIIYNPDSHAEGFAIPNTTKDSSVQPGIWADVDYIYIAILDKNATDEYIDESGYNYYHLRVRPIGAGSWSSVNFGDGLNARNMWIYKDYATGNWYVRRSTDGSTYKYYWLTGGGISEEVTDPIPSPGTQAQQDVNMAGCVTMMDTGNYSEFRTAYSYDWSWTDVYPTPTNLVSVMTYQPYNAGDPDPPYANTSTVNFEGDFTNQLVSAVAPHETPGVITALSGANGNGGGNDYNYSTLEIVDGFIGIDAYHALHVPAAYSPLSVDEYYWCGYPNYMRRWKPGDAAPTTVSRTAHYNYMVFLEYDTDGIIWVGSNYCGATAGCRDYGGLTWYNPSDGTNGEIFGELWTGGNPSDPNYETATQIKFNNFCMALNRTKIVISSNDGFLTVVDCATKSIEDSYELTTDAYMVEVSNDVVLGVTSSTDSNQVFRFKPSDCSILTPLQACGISPITAGIFGLADGSVNRRNFKLELGLDGYGWVFVDNSIYRIDPGNCIFTKVLDAANGKGKLKWFGTDLLVYYDGMSDRSGMDVYPDLLVES